MWPVSPAFLATLRQPSMIAVTQVVASDGTPLAVVAGSVDMDSRRAITRTASGFEFTPTADLSAGDVYDLLMQPGVEVSVSRGLLVNGTPELVPLGVFSTDTAAKPATGAITVKWSGSDRSKKIARARFTDAYVIPAGTPLAQAGADLLASRWSLTPVDFSTVTATVGAQVVFDAGAESDPWASAKSLFADHGYDLAFDGTGTARALPVPDPSTIAAAFDYGAGETNLVLDGETQGTFETTYSGVIVTGEGTDLAAPVRAEVWDDDPNSPTYYLGRFGKVPYFYSSPVLTTVGACEAAARTILARVKGRKSQFSWAAVVNPALVPLDVVTMQVRGESSRSVIDKLVVPARAADAMSTSAREVTVA
jgi:hypothetical protein